MAGANATFQPFLSPPVGRLCLGNNLYVAETDAALEHVKPLGIFLDRTFVSPEDPGVMSPCLIEDEGRWCLFFNIGPRLSNKVALAVAGPFTSPAPEP